MGRSRPMREANYRSNSYSKNKVKCEEVTARMINIGGTAISGTRKSDFLFSQQTM
ncbi:hypothetical protein LRS65_27170 (plasmid) [Bacillus cereus]|uniref:hypothetical protein n=1 Tax=Bacillus cereus TaxID=1396 RepID=UPI00211B77B1|nr:hypothetical protein [Bacillus cereus]UUN20222.1 hypothetical protein LRS65_27170 [Bacillus cereus]